MTSRRLIITNGDSAVQNLQAQGIGHQILAWQDVLHDGPVPGGIAPRPLAEARARFIAERGWASFEEAFKGLTERDRRLADLSGFEEVVLWFEHDLYDQLQLIQVLDRLAGTPGSIALTMITAAQYVGQLERDEARDLWESRKFIGGAPRELAGRAWAAFTAEKEDVLPAFAASDTSALPFLGPAFKRLLEERPGLDGLARSERQVLEVLAGGGGPLPAIKLYPRAHHQREEPVWLGDLSFAWYVERLAQGRVPLIGRGDGKPAAPWADGERAFWEQTLRITNAGRDVLAGRANHARLNGIDRWMGGVRLRVVAGA